MTALATPYLNGGVDHLSLERLVHLQSQAKVDFLLCLGTTGEQAFLSGKERLEVWQRVRANATMPVWAGVDCSVTLQAVKQAKYWQDKGADGLLISPPSFVKCTSQGYYQHVSAIAKSVDIPLMLYNVPSRCGYELDVNILEQLQASRKVRWIKDAGGSLGYTRRLCQSLQVLSGNDGLLTQQIKAGARGCVSVLANAWPNLARCAMAGNVPLWQRGSKAVYTQINPIGIKYMLYKMGIFTSYEMRLPLTAASSLLIKRVDRLLKAVGSEKL